jgi:hypothetical protein
MSKIKKIIALYKKIINELFVQKSVLHSLSWIVMYQIIYQVKY